MFCFRVRKKGNPTFIKIRVLVLVCFMLMMLPHFVFDTSADDGMYRSVKTDRKQIALTFDDGPHPHLTPQILRILERYHAKATFFMIGKNVVNYPQAAKDVIQAGHEVGNHTFSHEHLANLNPSSLLQEVGKCEDVLEELCEYRPHLFRPPEGADNVDIRHCIQENDYTMILWSIDTRDWECKNEAEIVHRVLNAIQPGDIVLMHDYIGRSSQTPQALEILLPELIDQGYELVTVSELLGLS